MSAELHPPPYLVPCFISDVLGAKSVDYDGKAADKYYLVGSGLFTTVSIFVGVMVRFAYVFRLNISEVVI